MAFLVYVPEFLRDEVEPFGYSPSSKVLCAILPDPKKKILPRLDTHALFLVAGVVAVTSELLKYEHVTILSMWTMLWIEQSSPLLLPLVGNS